MSNREKILNDFYTNICDEDSRLIKDKRHKVEFLTTTTYIEKYLKKGDRILEVGAATGRYSLYYAKKGYKVKISFDYDDPEGMLEWKNQVDSMVSYLEAT